ncbi:hypothetical protein GGS20DRAFT_267660 [Poronia punctata]|nr:hypothetical protein GGS20DRAFT_267660 [Poronia punctata]
MISVSVCSSSLVEAWLVPFDVLVPPATGVFLVQLRGIPVMSLTLGLCFVVLFLVAVWRRNQVAGLLGTSAPLALSYRTGISRGSSAFVHLADNNTPGGWISGWNSGSHISRSFYMSICEAIYRHDGLDHNQQGCLRFGRGRIWLRAMSDVAQYRYCRHHPLRGETLVPTYLM